MRKLLCIVIGLGLMAGMLFAQGSITVSPKLGPMKPGSNADDPAIWIHPSDPAKSLFFLSDKSAGVFVYNVQGQQLQHINFGTALNNIDVRYDFNLGGQNIDILAGNLRSASKLALMRINPNSTSPLSILADKSSSNNTISSDSYGFALYRRPADGAMFAFDKPASNSPIKQFLIDGSSGQIVVTPVRTINDVAMGQSEGFVADDELGFVYFAEEGKGIHKYNADPASSTLSRLSFFASGDGTVSDREGLCLYVCDNGGGYLILSSQGNSTFKVYERGGSNRFVRTFVAQLSEGTDGLDVSSAVIPGFPNGFVIIHDDPQMQYYVYDWADIAGSELTVCPDGGNGGTLPPVTKVATPVIDPSGGVFANAVEVSLSTVTAGASIRYTVNGSNPTSASALYGGPFAVTANATVKARAFKSGMADSEVANASFIVAVPPPDPLEPAITSFNPGSGSVGNQVTITGENLGDASSIKFNGKIARVMNVINASRIVVQVPQGASTGKITVTTPAGTATSTNNFVVTAAPPAGAVITFHPSDDAFVKSASANSHFGSAPTLRARNSNKKDVVSFLKFEVDGLDGAVQRAVLRLYATSRSKVGGAVFAAANDYKGSTNPWTQDGVTWNNAPAVDDPQLSEIGPVAAKSWAEFEVTAAVHSEGTFSFALTSDANEVVFYSSQEGPFSPELVILTGNGAASARAAGNGAAEMIESVESAPERFTLAPAYPNPFNGMATIEYALPEAGPVRLMIYNSLGQAVRVLVDEVESAGHKRAQWDATDDRGLRVSSGVYLYQIEYARRRHTGRVILQQ